MITFYQLKTFVSNHIAVKPKNVVLITELKDILWVVNYAPRYINRCDFSKVEDFVWIELLKEHPHLLNKYVVNQPVGNKQADFIEKMLNFKLNVDPVDEIKLHHMLVKEWYIDSKASRTSLDLVLEVV